VLDKGIGIIQIYNMSKIEKYIILLVLLSAICGIALNITGHIIEDNLKHHWAFIISYFSLIGLNLYYFIKFKHLINKLIFFLLAITTYSHISKIMHWTGTGIFVILGWISSIIIAGLLLKQCLDSIKSSRNIVIYFFIISLILIAQLILHFTAYHFIGAKLNYVLIAIILTMKLKIIKINPNLGKMMNVLLLLAIYQLVRDVLQFLK
jgi:hypothetical protein